MSARITGLLLSVGLLLSACGQAVGAAGGSAAPSATAVATPMPTRPSVADLTAVGEQLFPLIAQYGYYAECINYPEHGAADVTRGNDYSACPLTDAMRARLQQTQAHLCPCEQNPSTTREITAVPRPGGGLLTVKLYSGLITVELVVVSQSGRLLVSDEPAKGTFESTPIVFQDKPTPTPTPVRPTAQPGSNTRILNVPWYHQAFELSCEEASLRMALAYEGIATTDSAVLQIIGSDLRPAYVDSTGLHWGDPFATFVGNVNGSEIALTGYGTYYPTIAHAAAVLGGHVLRAGQGIAAADIYQAVLNGHPVVTWVTYRWVRLHRQDYVAFDGRTVTYAGPGEHAVVVVGVTPTRVLINNPWSGPEWISKSVFEPVYATYDNMAVVLS